jgi:hypothetical protein
MTTDQEKFQILSALIKSKVPSFENKTKDQSFLLSKVAGPVVKIFNKNFLDDYITTLGTTVYWPNQEAMDADWAWKVLAHEYVHICDYKRSPVSFVLKYGFPQIFAPLAIIAIAAFWSLWFLLGLVFLLCLIPWPAPGRTWAEMRGYTMSMAVEDWTGWIPDDMFFDWISGQFTSMAYYRMSPDNEAIHTQLRVNLAAIKDGSILIPEENAPFRDVYQMLKDNGDLV